MKRFISILMSLTILLAMFPAVLAEGFDIENFEPVDLTVTRAVVNGATLRLVVKHVVIQDTALTADELSNLQIKGTAATKDTDETMEIYEVISSADVRENDTLLVIPIPEGYDKDAINDYTYDLKLYPAATVNDFKPFTLNITALGQGSAGEGGKSRVRMVAPAEQFPFDAAVGNILAGCIISGTMTRTDETEYPQSVVFTDIPVEISELRSDGKINIDLKVTDEINVTNIQCNATGYKQYIIELTIFPAVKALPSPSPEVTESPSASPEATESPSPSPEVTESPSPSPEVTASPSSSPEVTESPSPSPKVTESPSPSPEVTESPSPSTEVTESPISSPEVTESPSPSPEATKSPSTSPEVTESPNPSPEVTKSPSPSPEVTESPSTSPEVTESPSPSPGDLLIPENETTFFIKPADFATDKGTWTINSDGVMEGIHDKNITSETASAIINVSENGTYYIWVLAYDNAESDQGEGTFKIGINGETLADTLGNHGSTGYKWQLAGICELKKGECVVKAVDTSNYYARMKGIMFTTSSDFEGVNPELLDEAFEKYGAEIAECVQIDIETAKGDKVVYNIKNRTDEDVTGGRLYAALYDETGMLVEVKIVDDISINKIEQTGRQTIEFSGRGEWKTGKLMLLDENIKPLAKAGEFVFTQTDTANPDEGLDDDGTEKDMMLDYVPGNENH